MDPVTVAKAAQISLALAKSRKVRVVVAATIVLQALMLVTMMLAPMWLLGTLTGSRASQRQFASTDSSCPTALGDTSGPVTAPQLTSEQRGNAQIIVQTGLRLGAGTHGAVVAIATALQESGLRNLNYGDRDSLGLFQQRASWGTAAVRTNPAAASELFYRVLLRTTGWQTLTVTQAAQAVQRSAFPDAYAKHERTATALVAAFTSPIAGTGESGGVVDAQWLASGLCGSAGAATCPVTGLGVEQGLTPDALRVLRCVKQQWPQFENIGGIGDRPGNVDRDHQEGRAVDVMIADYTTAAGQRLGQAVAEWVIAHRQQLGVSYVIWRAKIWSTDRASEGWRTCGSAKASCYSGPDDTAAHRDHVHISVYGDQAGTTATGSADTGAAVAPLAAFVLTARFGQCSTNWTACHTGLDFAAPVGRSVRAVQGGRVTFVGWGGRYGRLTKIDHGAGVESWYAHQSTQTVQVGQTVTAGQSIGLVGVTGNTTGPHLHLEIRRGGTPIDPAIWLSGKGAL